MKAIFHLILLTGILIFPLQAQVINSLYSDVKARQVGDVVSIIVVETANATRESSSNNSSQADMSAGGSVTGNLTDFLPSFGASTNVSNSYDGSEGTAQSDRLTGRITVKIVEQTDAGMFRISGDRTVEVNGESNVMHLDGLIRPRDIMSNNTVYSYNIADAKITYKKDGFVDSMVSPGTLPTIFTGLLGIGLIALAVGLIVL